MNNPPYIFKTRTVTDKLYNPKFGDDRICICGHTYYRHFDSYDNMAAVGCKYCQCSEFEDSTQYIEAYDRIKKCIISSTSPSVSDLIMLCTYFENGIVMKDVLIKKESEDENS